MVLHEAPSKYEKVIHYDEAKETQVRLVVNSFRGIEYMHVRKYFLDFDRLTSLFIAGTVMPSGACLL